MKQWTKLVFQITPITDRLQTACFQDSILLSLYFRALYTSQSSLRKLVYLTSFCSSVSAVPGRRVETVIRNIRKQHMLLCHWQPPQLKLLWQHWEKKAEGSLLSYTDISRKVLEERSTIDLEEWAFIFLQNLKNCTSVKFPAMLRETPWAFLLQ